MPVPFDTITAGLSSAWTTGGTLTLGYPAGRSRGDYLLVANHEVAVPGRTLVQGRDFSVTLNATTVVFTMVALNTTVPAGTTVYVTLQRNGALNSSFEGALDQIGQVAGSTKTNVTLAPTLMVSMGSPIAISTTGVRTSLTFAAPGTTLATALTLVMDGARVTGGRALMDVPRNITITSAANLAGYTFYLTGLDTANSPMAESITGVNANTVAGLKAWSRVDSVRVFGTGTPAAVSIGFGKVLGLPFYLPTSRLVLAEMENGGAPGAAGTFVVGSVATPTATSGDTRGTYSPNATPDGSIALHLIVACANPHGGVPQFGS
jgi:hypothetical protein